MLLRKLHSKIRLKGFCKMLAALAVFLPAPASSTTGIIVSVLGHKEKKEVCIKFDKSEAGKNAQLIKFEKIEKAKELKEQGLISKKECDSRVQYFESYEYYIKQLKQSEFGEAYDKAETKYIWGLAGGIIATCVLGAASSIILCANSNKFSTVYYERPGHSEMGKDISFSFIDNEITFMLIDGAKELVTGKKCKERPKEPSIFDYDKIKKEVEEKIRRQKEREKINEEFSQLVKRNDQEKLKNQNSLNNNVEDGGEEYQEGNGDTFS